MITSPRRLSAVRVAAGSRLDVGEARRMLGLVRGAQDGAPVEIDISGARDVEPTGLATLAAGLAESGRRAFFRGLCERHVRILRYFGLDPTAPPPLREAPTAP